MRSLFLRVFLWFWLAMAVVVAVLVVTSPYFTRSRPGLEDWHRGAEEGARRMIDRIAMHVEEVGVGDSPMGRGRGQGPRDGRGRRQMPAKVFIIGQDGTELRGDGAPEEVFEIARHALSSEGELTERSGALYLIARPVDSSDGRRVAVVVAHHSPPRLIHLLEPKALAWRLGVLFLVVGGLSFWLARYLSSPVGPLRRATRRLSRGDLSARVEGRVNRRKDEIGELARDFDAMAERIETLVGSQQRLLRDVSHELRSPLARLVVALELARARAGEGAAEPLDRIGCEADRLDELIGQLLLLERLEAGSSDHGPIEFDVDQLLAEVVSDASFEAEAKDREVRFGSGGSGYVRGHPGLLRSAVDNVVRNAVHHTQAGGAVEVGSRTVDDGVEITVHDGGQGVPPEALERIFDPFYRVGEARDRSSGGVGLGLAIARRGVEANGGAISAANHPDGGLLVTIRLPVSGEEP
jgi:two-component system sensor histidine kinase CpxA